MSANDLDKAEQGAAEKLTKPENGSPEDGKAADGGLDADEVEPKLAPFAGMGKEELLKVSSEPFWVYTRWTLLVLFWLAWIAMLVGAIVIIVTAPRCAPRPELEWWEHGGFLRVFTRSFKDSDGNGIGDLKGIEEKADYLKELNVKSVQISAPYGAGNFTDVDPDFGTMADFDSLVAALHDKGLKLVVDFDPNHSGVDHPWFVQSAASSADDNAFKDYYVWADGVGGNPPNNWLSVTGGPAWNYSAARDQWYLHTFQPEQPDLNYRNADVRAAVMDALRFWAARGADGFRLTSAKYLVEDAALTDEPANPNYSGDPGKYDSLSHPYTTNTEETHSLLQEFRTTLDEFAKDGDSYRLLLADVMDANVRQVVKYYSSNGTREADIVLNYDLLALQGGADKPGNKTFGRIQSWINNLPDGKRANWMIGSANRRSNCCRLNSSTSQLMTAPRSLTSPLMTTSQRSTRSSSPPRSRSFTSRKQKTMTQQYPCRHNKFKVHDQRQGRDSGNKVHWTLLRNSCFGEYYKAYSIFNGKFTMNESHSSAFGRN
ncbi:amino acid transporter heavy chain SLC3A1-like isoform X2 [Branchiostoma lanceolatum]|uniref:amino acid transporter heavy chain SLC3A1-like isoform X2 n=1 Tax=Branchiostoma lanceolatum TaxID=7740 RepID=UPI003452E222